MTFDLQFLIVVHCAMMLSFSALFAGITLFDHEWRMPWSFSIGYLVAPSVMVATGIGMLLGSPILTVAGLISGFAGPCLACLGGARLFDVRWPVNRWILAFLAYAGAHVGVATAGYGMVGHLLVVNLTLLGFAGIVALFVKTLSVEDHRLGRSLFLAVSAFTAIMQSIRVFLILFGDGYEEPWQMMAATMIVGATVVAALGGAGMVVLIAERFAAQIRRQARTDSLTGLLVRRVFDDQIIREMDRWRRHRRPFAVVLFDIDHFKKVNDNHGHDIGDEALRLIARCGRAALRPSDVLARLGGDEFAMILPETGLKQAVEVAHRVLDGIREQALATPKGPIHLTGSFGVANVRETDDAVETIVKRADEALYTIKRRGRNGVASSDDEPAA